MIGKVFITGASGFVGSHLVEKAHKLGLEVHAAVRKSSNTNVIAPFVDRFVYPDMNNQDELKELFEIEQYDYIIHAAAMTKAKLESEMLKVNVDYTHNLIAASKVIGDRLKQFVFISSLAAIGPICYDSVKAISEDAAYSPVTVYGRSKQAAEEMIKRDFADWPITVLRPTAVYGPRERDLFILFDTLNKGFDPYIGSKPQKLSFVYVQDLIDVILRACVVGSEKLSFYNISDGHVYSKYAMAEIFKQTFNRKPLRLHLPYALVSFVAQLSQKLYKKSDKTPVLYPERLGELMAENWDCAISKAQQELHYSPKYDLKAGLKETLLWYKENGWL